MGEIELVYSKHCQKVTRNEQTVELLIYSSGKNDWILEVVDKDNNSTVWDGEFESDDEAYREFQSALAEEGIESMIGLRH